MFFDEYARNLHPTFKKELSRQLWLKGNQTGIKQFDKHNFQLIVGMQPMDIRKTEKKILATIEFITPTSWSIPITISWTTKTDTNKLEHIHKNEVTSDSIIINWEDNFPLEKVQVHISPYKKSKAEKNAFGFDVEYFYLLLPDVELEILFKSTPTKTDIDAINNLLITFEQKWNQTKKGKEINYISELTQDNSHYSVTLDIGQKNTIRTINELLKLLGESHHQLIEKIQVK